MQFKFLAWATAFLGITACSDSSNSLIDQNPPLPEASYHVVTCQSMLSEQQMNFLTPGSTCGYLDVPTKYTVQGQTLSEDRLQVAVIKLAARQAQNKYADPLVYLDGGPGGAASNLLRVFFHNQLLEFRDIYLVDQRGTGLSKPALLCDEYKGEFEQIAACHKRFKEEGVDLDSFRSVYNALDFVELRKALNIEQWNLYGASYGTRLATTILRENTQGIRSVVLDGMFPIEVNGISDSGWVNFEVLNQILVNCSHSTACPSDLQQTIEAIVLNLYNQNRPQEVSSFLNNIINQVADPELLHFIRSYQQGVNEISERTLDPAPFYLGMALSTICAEEYPFLGQTVLVNNNRQGWSAILADSIDATTDLHFATQACKYWPVSKAHETETKAVSTNLPVLLLNGSNDTQTPVSWGELAASNMPMAQMVINPAGGHVQLAADNQCIRQITDDFLATPAKVLNLSCVEQIPGVDYK